MAPSFSVSDLKKRVGEGYTATRDKYASTSSKSPIYNPPRPGGNKPPAPPPPAPRSKLSSFNSPAENAVQEEGDDTIDWVNLTEEDKQVFFSWLDEFFSRLTGKPISSFAPTGQHEVPAAPRPVHSVPVAPILPRRTTSDAPSMPASTGSIPPPMPSRRTSSQTSSPAPPMPPRQVSGPGSAVRIEG